MATEAKNGAEAISAPSIVTIPRREVWLEMPAEYGEAGMKAKIWVNYPRRLAGEIASGDLERIRAAMQTICLEHNGWHQEDEHGTPVPMPQFGAAEFWDLCPDELAGSLMALIFAESTKLPSSLRPTRRG